MDGTRVVGASPPNLVRVRDQGDDEPTVLVVEDMSS